VRLAVGVIFAGVSATDSVRLERADNDDICSVEQVAELDRFRRSVFELHPCRR